jgi:hypothetical protein
MEGMSSEKPGISGRALIVWTVVLAGGLGLAEVLAHWTRNGSFPAVVAAIWWIQLYVMWLRRRKSEQRHRGAEHTTAESVHLLGRQA